MRSQSKSSAVMETRQLRSDVNGIMDEIEVVLAGIQRFIEMNKPILVNRKSSGMGFDVTTNLSISIGILEHLTEKQMREDESLVDVLEDGHTVKIVALIPGVRKEDVEVQACNGVVDIKIRSGGKMIYKSIPCNLSPDQVSIRSIMCNNSVLEITFDRDER